MACLLVRRYLSAVLDGRRCCEDRRVGGDAALLVVSPSFGSRCFGCYRWFRTYRFQRRIKRPSLQRCSAGRRSKTCRSKQRSAHQSRAGQLANERSARRPASCSTPMARLRPIPPWPAQRVAFGTSAIAARPSPQLHEAMCGDQPGDLQLPATAGTRGPLFIGSDSTRCPGRFRERPEVLAGQTASR